MGHGRALVDFFRVLRRLGLTGSGDSSRRLQVPHGAIKPHDFFELFLIIETALAPAETLGHLEDESDGKLDINGSGAHPAAVAGLQLP